jgi:hypothetical protein
MLPGFVPTISASLLLLLALGGVARAADPAPAINVSEICTTCNDVLRCTRAQDSPAPASAPVVIYHLHPESTWDQIKTIWEYLSRFGKAKTTNIRDLTIYDLPGATGPAGRVQDGLEAVLDATTLTIELPGARIDRATGQWFLLAPTPGASPVAAGSCQLLSPVAGRELLQSLAPPQ